MSTNWENKRAEIMAKPPPTGGERGVFYPIFIAAELAAGYRYTTDFMRQTKRDLIRARAHVPPTDLVIPSVVKNLSTKGFFGVPPQNEIPDHSAPI
jgi:hypothetical protein